MNDDHLELATVGWPIRVVDDPMGSRGGSPLTEGGGNDRLRAMSH